MRTLNVAKRFYIVIHYTRTSERVAWCTVWFKIKSHSLKSLI